MGWAKIEFGGVEAKSQAQWFRAVFMQVVWRLPDAATEQHGTLLGPQDPRPRSRAWGAFENGANLCRILVVS